ncbi:hypothetical protein M3J09_009434 [Ascochyta lentis]
MRREERIAEQLKQHIMLSCQSVLLKFVIGYRNAVYTVVDRHLLEYPSIYNDTLEVVIHVGPAFVAQQSSQQRPKKRLTAHWVDAVSIRTCCFVAARQERLKVLRCCCGDCWWRKIRLATV